MLAGESGRPVTAINLPWPNAAPASHEERLAARKVLGLAMEQPVVLYAGNLDAYQGLDAVLPAMLRLMHRRPGLTWLIATESPTAPLADKLAALGLDEQVKFTSLANETTRRRVHAAADLALVPRGAAGGIPIKLLDALARGVPVVTSRIARAGLALPPEAVTLVEDFDDWHVAIDHALKRTSPACEDGRAFIAKEHGSTRFVSDLIAHAGRWQLLVPSKE
jgi:glycosyltransferase involved in cell wall biosynthesis